MYFGQSFGRIGADFRLSLVPIFTDAIRDVALAHLSGVDLRFKTGIDQLALKANVSSSASINVKNVDVSEEGKSHQPPMSLLDFPPLAELCNTILSCLNELRLLDKIFTLHHSNIING